MFFTIFTRHHASILRYKSKSVSKVPTIMVVMF